MIKKNKTNKDWILKYLNIFFSSVSKITYAPFMSILFSIFSCNEENKVIYIQSIKCNSSLHILYKFSSILTLLIYLPSVILLNYCYINFIKIKEKKFTKRTTEPDVYMFLLNVYFTSFHCLFDNKFNDIILLIGTLFSIFVFFEYYYYKPISDEKIMKITLTKVSIFAFTNVILNLLYYIKQYHFNGGIIIYLIGLIVIIFYILYPLSQTYEVKKLFKIPFRVNHPLEYSFLIEKLMNMLTNIHKERNEHFIIETYINYHMETCLNKKDCDLYKFLESKGKDMYFVYKYIDILFKYGLNKWRDNIRLQLLYIEFLFKNMEKTHKAKRILNLIKEKANISLMESFHIYQLEKIIEGDLIQYDNHSGFLTEIQFLNKKNMLINNIKEAIINYIFFWNLLLSTKNDILLDLGQLSKIGNKISILNEEINNNYLTLIQANNHDKNLFTLYNIYKYEILNLQNYIPSQNYENVFFENENDIFVFDENLGLTEIIEKNRQSKIIIISANYENFGQITHASLSSCSYFGFIKDEFIGKSLNILIPEFCLKPHNDIMFSYSSDFHKKIKLHGFTKNQYMLQNFIHFGINKAKMLLVFFMDIIFHYDENGNKSFIMNLTESNDDENNYIITNSDFYIENFSLNGIKNLNLKRNFINSQIDIFNHINQFHDDYIKKICDNNQKKLNVNKIKREIISKYLKESNNVNWSIEPLKSSPNYLSAIKNLSKKKMRKISFVESLSPTQNVSFNNSFDSFNNIYQNEIKDIKNDDNLKDSIFKFNFSEYFLKGFNFSKKTYSSNNSEIRNSLKNVKYNLKVKEIKFKEKVYGYIFILREIDEISNSSNYEKKNESNIFIDKLKKNKYNEEEENRSKHSIQNFFNFEKSIKRDFLPRQKNKFFIDFEKKSYIQIKINNEKEEKKKLKEKIQKAALKKINDINEQLKENEEENEEEEEEDEEEEEEYSGFSNPEKIYDKIMIKSIKNEIRKNSVYSKKSTNNNDNQNKDSKIQSIFRKGILSIKKSSKQLNNFPIIENNLYNLIEGKYYKVNFSNIHFLIYDYKKEIALEIKDDDFKKSEILKKIEDKYNEIQPPKIQKKSNEREKNNIKHLRKNTEIIEDKLYNQLNDLDDRNIVSKEMLKKQIQHSLKRKDTQKSVNNIKIVTYLILLVLLIQLISILFFLRKWINDIEIHLTLIKESNQYFSNLIFSSHSIRELTLLVNENYTNFWGDKIEYTNYFINLLKKYYEKLSVSNEIISSYLFCIDHKVLEKVFENKVDMYFLDENERLIKIIGTYSGIQSYFGNCLQTITLLPFKKMIPLNSNIYFFLNNCFNVISENSEIESNLYENELFERFKRRLVYMIIIIIIEWIIDFLLFNIFKYYFMIIIQKRESYFEIFYLLSSKLIAESLTKCEQLLQKLQNNKKDENLDNLSLSYSILSSEDSESKSENNLNKFQISVINQEEEKLNNFKKNYAYYIYFIWGIMIVINLFTITFFFCVQYTVYKNYKESIKLTKNILTQELSVVNLYNFLREYIFDENKSYHDMSYGNIFHFQISSYYLTLSQQFKQIEKSIKYNDKLKQKYSEIFHGNLCDNLTSFFSKYMPNKKCATYSGKSLNNGLTQVLIYFLENLRYIYSQYFNQKRINELYDFKYNLTLIGTKNENSLLPKNSSFFQLYYLNHPINIFNLNEFKESNFLMLNVIVPYFFEFYETVLENTFYKKRNLMIFYNFFNMISIIITLFIFLICWKKYELQLNNSIFKTKNMLGIIPIDTLIYVKNINKLLGIEEQFDKTKSIIWK